MRLQVVKDSKGIDTGVFIPIEDWMAIKKSYPDIEETVNEVPDWEKELIDQRLEAISKNPDSLKPGNELLDELKR